MAFINCPECGKQVSDKAVACIHCGYPLNEITQKVVDNTNALYDVVYLGFTDNNTKNKNQAKVVGQLRQILNTDLSATVKLLSNPPYTLMSGVKRENAEWLEKLLYPFGCKVEIRTSSASKSSDSQFEKFGGADIICPHCGSTSITTGQRGFKLTTGFLGSNKTVNRCGKCGYTWNP